MPTWHSIHALAAVGLRFHECYADTLRMAKTRRLRLDRDFMNAMSRMNASSMLPRLQLDRDFMNAMPGSHPPSTKG